ncbi:FkbM family methyltransferase [Amycolatopsis sp., V23-08]|uniref:FkbM family methyltransferase n=1 Tax=Amycolatopsis heterodermiae TaxID=3110235 RepID=A0ABU5R852_9PSEU|nr:FkbM family methyltransferase [Amycolatopsis sp., V23-08]MEA5362328.1 FkbM family methyltransferase [Amycolatopsis sp., V23-08]
MPQDLARLVPPPMRALLKRTVNRFGLEVSRDPFARRLVRLCDALGVRSVVDVGANSGQYARLLRSAGYDGRILSCEPLAVPFGMLHAAATGDAAWDTVRTALGRETGRVTVHVAGNSYSSSVLDMLPAHVDAAPDSRCVGHEDVPMTTVDDLLGGEVTEPVLLKMDVQGYEAEVLAGAEKTLPSLSIVQAELSLVPLYGAQPLMDEIVRHLDDRGFAVWSLEPGFRDARTGRMLQCDGIFVRRDLVPG